jgi:Domain of unknown function (DUF4336)
MSAAFDSRDPDRSWLWWPIVPLYPYGQRRTLRREVVPGRVWMFDQVQGVLSVVVPIRMTIVRLDLEADGSGGGLLVYAPVAATGECIRLVEELVAEFGPVRFVLLPTGSGLEHKVFVGPFARRFPGALVYVSPSQWSFPIDLPLSWLGLPIGRTRRLPVDSGLAPFGADVDYAILGPVGLGLGCFEEVALFHRSSRTLLLTDTIVSIPLDPPPIVALEDRALLYHAKEDRADWPIDCPEMRRKGWWRIVLFAFYFRPGSLDIVELLGSFRGLSLGDARPYGGWFPYRWKQGWEASFERLRQGGEPVVAPILRQLILHRAQGVTRGWVDRVASWDFERMIPCHLDGPIEAGPEAFRRAFEPLLEGEDENILADADDLRLLRQIRSGLERLGITPKG